MTLVLTSTTLVLHPLTAEHDVHINALFASYDQQLDAETLWAAAVDAPRAWRVSFEKQLSWVKGLAPAKKHGCWVETSWNLLFPQVVMPITEPFASVRSCHCCTETLWEFECLPEAESGWKHAVSKSWWDGFQMHASLEGELKFWSVCWLLDLFNSFSFSLSSCSYMLYLHLKM